MVIKDDGRVHTDFNKSVTQQKEPTNDGMVIKQDIPKETLCVSKEYYIWQQAIYYE